MRKVGAGKMEFVTDELGPFLEGGTGGWTWDTRSSGSSLGQLELAAQI